MKQNSHVIHQRRGPFHGRYAMSVISFEDVNVHELASSQTTTPPEEAPHVQQALQPAGETHDAVDAWLHAAEAALQGGQAADVAAACRGRLLMHEANNAAMLGDEPTQLPAKPPESRYIGAPSLMLVAVSTITTVVLLAAAGMARARSAHDTPAAAACHPEDGPWSAIIQLQWALSNLTHIATSLGAAASALAPHSIVATEARYAGAETTPLPLWDARSAAVLCCTLAAASSFHSILSALIIRLAHRIGHKPRRQLTTPTQRKRTLVCKPAACAWGPASPPPKREWPPQTPPRAAVQHAGTQTPPPKAVVLPDARGSRRSARIMVQQMAQAQQQQMLA